ncbi:glycosyltransferase [Bifidobacterium phasiani]|uniref:Glycosyltransferase n=1 Tax=Bifidobacterium phasiani TaxID=2834431 RepID=A0ABS6W7Y9_9BIFI|nr:glycosyltransferase [Bifidobacterium phasiani]MBW3082616.1 glycosyltransferase [Bifidobacterium phasiani]
MTNAVNVAMPISLSVVLYRDYRTPAAMIRSLMQFTDSRLQFQIIAVDNSNLSSGDPLIEERNRFVSEFSNDGFGPGSALIAHRFLYVDVHENLGFGRANNVALDMVNSQYHAYVNPDILFIGDTLTALKSFMDAHPDVGMCIPRMVDAQGHPLKVYRRNITVLDAFNRMFLKNRLRKRDYWHTMSDKDYSKPFQVPFGQGSFLFARTKLLKQLGGFDDSYFMYLEDADLCRRVNQVSQLVYCPDAVVVHKWEQGSHKNPRLFKEHLKSYAIYFRKWGLSLA